MAFRGSGKSGWRNVINDALEIVAALKRRTPAFSLATEESEALGRHTLKVARMRLKAEVFEILVSVYSVAT
jgi:hypothetical protein